MVDNIGDGRRPLLEVLGDRVTYTEQIEGYVAAYPQTTQVRLSETCGVVALPAFPHVVVHVWAEDYCELEDVNGADIARFRLVG
jgi:hypothetical protein